MAFYCQEVVIEEWTSPDGAPYTSLVLEPGNVVRAPRFKKLTGANKVAFDALVGLLEKSTDDLTAEASRQGIAIAAWRDACYSQGISESDNTDARRKAFERARKALMNSGRVQCSNDLYQVVLNT
jgi:hypothetical protein